VAKKLTTLDDPSGSDTYCVGINSNNVIVGWYTNSSGNTQAFIYKDGKFRNIGPSGSVGTGAYGINDSGIVTGWYTDSAGVQHGFVWDGTTYTTLDVPGASWTNAFAMNNKGIITVQWGDSAGHVEASLYNSNTKKYSKPINVPGAVNTYAHAIDSAGDVVYSWQDSKYVYHGAMCTKCTSSGRKYYKFDDPKGAGEDWGAADGINDHKLIGGCYSNKHNVDFGFKATY